MPQTITTERIEERIVEALVVFGADPAAISRDAELTALDIDSLDMVELAQIVEDEFGATLKTEDLAELRTVADAIDLVAERAA
jgi:acyl carrier protein